jgi:hypothetical protein
VLNTYFDTLHHYAYILRKYSQRDVAEIGVYEHLDPQGRQYFTTNDL